MSSMQPNTPGFMAGPSPYGSPQAPPPAHAARRRFNMLIIPLSVLTVLFLVSLGFGVWAFASRQDFKNNTDQKVAAAVEAAQKQTAEAKDKEFLEKEKEPLKEYRGPATYGSIHLKYPKTWSAYVSETGTGSVPLDGYFHPGFVPGISSGASFALRVQVSNQPYDQEMKQFESKVKSNKVKVSPYKAPKVSGTVLGSLVEGEIGQNQKGSMVVFPLRDKTIKISTESNQFLGDFTNIILANLTFVP